MSAEITENEKVIRRLYEITSRHDQGFDHQVRELLHLGCERFGLDIGILANITGNRYRIVHQVSPDDIPMVDGAEFDLPETYCAITLAANRPVGFEHVARSEIRSHPAYKAFALESYIGTPLVVDGERYGTLNFSSPYPRNREFADIDLDALMLMGIWIEGELSRMQYQQKILRQAGELARRNEQLLKLAKTDGLTQVGNRYSFYEELGNQLRLAQRIQMPVSIIMFDIDDFKDYNDTFGHVAGDEALVTISGTVAGMARATDYVARYGGEEFIVLLPDTDQQEALMTAERLRRAVNDISSLKRKVSSSFGITTFVPHEPGAFDYDSLSKNLTDEADQALYQAKNGGKNRAVHFGTR